MGSSPFQTFEKKKIVFYLRYSSVNQRGDSIDDQRRNIITYLEREGIPYSGFIELADPAMSGTTTRRPGFQKLLAMLDNNELAMVVVDDFSRLTRSKDYGLLWDRMVAHGCRFISTIDGLDSTRDSDETSAMVKGLMNNITNKLNGKRSRRGLVGRVLDPNASAGCHPYGYESRFCDPDAAAKYTGVGPKPKKDLFICEEQTDVVRMVFRLYGEEGWSPSQIARYLNEQKIPTGARSQRINEDGTRYSSGWHKVLIRKMLMQRKYIGDWSWGLNKHTKTHEGKQIVLPANPADVIRVEKPYLAIIPMELWDRVQTRREKFVRKYGYQDGQQRRGRRSHYTEDYPNSLLGGLLYCGECGHRLHFVPENHGQSPYYGCPIAQSKGRNKGAASCSQRGYVRADRATEALSGYLRNHLLGCEGWLKAVYDKAKSEFLHQQAAAPDECDSLRKKCKDFDSAIANLMTAIETAAAAPEILVKRLGVLEAQRNETERALRQQEAQITRIASLPSREWVQEQLLHLANILQEDTPKAAGLYREFFGEVRVSIVVAPGKKRGHPVLSFQHNTAALLPKVFGFDLPLSGMPAEAGETVCLALDGSNKLDKLMPTIDAMRRAGVEWREICSKLRVARSWTNLYYNRWKKLTQAAEANNAMPATVA